MSPLTLITLFLVVFVLGAVLGALAGAIGRGLRWEAHAGAVALPLLLLLPWLGSNRILAPCTVLAGKIPGAAELEVNHDYDLLNDDIYQFLPWEMDVRRALREGRLPLWSDLLGGGSSPWINLQAAVLSPIANLTRLFPIQSFLLVGLFFKLQVAFAGTWLLARSVGLRRVPAVLAATSFTLGGGMQAFGLFPHTYVLAWVPWAAAATVALTRSRTTPAPALRCAAALTWIFVLLSGHPEAAALGCIFALTCALFLRRRGGVWSTRLVAIGQVLAIAGGIAAVQWLPFVLALPMSQRGGYVFGPQAPLHGLSLLSVLLPHFVRGVLHPHPYGIPFQDSSPGVTNWVELGTGYTGILGVAGALAVLATHRRKRAAPFLGVALLGLGVAARFVPLALPLHLVSPLRVFLNQRPLFLVALSLSLLAGFGADAILRSARWRLLTALALVAAAASLAVGLEPRLALLWALLLLSPALKVLAGRRAAAVLLATVALLDLFPWARRRLPEGPPELFYPRTEAMELIAGEVAKPGGPWRATGESFSVYPALLTAYGIAEIRTHDPLAQRPYLATLAATVGFGGSAEYFQPLKNVDHPFLDFLGVRVVVSNWAQPRKQTLRRFDGNRFDGFRLFRNPDALPRAFLPIEAVPVAPDELAVWLHDLDDGRRVAVPAGTTAPPARPWSAENVEILAASPGHLSLYLPTDSKKLVATSLTQPRGWTARAAGGRLPTLTINGAFLGVEVPPGIDHLDLRYRPPGLVLGGTYAALALLGLCALAVQALRARRRRPPRISAAKGTQAADLEM